MSEKMTVDEFITHATRQINDAQDAISRLMSSKLRVTLAILKHVFKEGAVERDDEGSELLQRLIAIQRAARDAYLGCSPCEHLPQQHIEKLKGQIATEDELIATFQPKGEAK